MFSFTSPPSKKPVELVRFYSPEIKNKLITLLDEAESKYTRLCKTEQAPGWTGRKRKKEFDRLLLSLKESKSNVDEHILSFQKLLKANDKDGRLMDLLDNALWEFSHQNDKLETSSINRNSITGLLTQVEKAYDDSCKATKVLPGTEGKKRNAEFSEILNDFRDEKRNFNGTFYRFNKFFIKRDNSSRLMRYLETAMWKIFKLKLNPSECVHCRQRYRRLGLFARAQADADRFLNEMTERHEKLNHAMQSVLNPITVQQNNFILKK